MNFIVGNLLKYLNEEESFWVFVSITENILPIDYYSDMMGILVDQKVFEILLKERYPRVVSHMQKHNYQLDLIAFQWLVTLFFNSLEHETEKFILTAFLLKGSKIIIRLALLIIEYFKQDVLKANAFDQIYMIISQNPYSEVDNIKISQLLIESRRLKVTNSILTRIRDLQRQDIVLNLQDNLDKSIAGNQPVHNRRLKFLNQFYLFNGLSKYYEHLLKRCNGGLLEMSD